LVVVIMRPPTPLPPVLAPPVPLPPEPLLDVELEEVVEALPPVPPCAELPDDVPPLHAAMLAATVRVSTRAIPRRELLKAILQRYRDAVPHQDPRDAVPRAVRHPAGGAWAHESGRRAPADVHRGMALARSLETFSN
jgi:hypothetical protein